ncbi:hypothetical protein BH11BAC4_BH11BAC4_15600 [soil metagenome]
MKKIVVLFAGLCIAVLSFAQKQLVVDPNAEIRSVSGSYTTIMVSGGIDLYLSQSDEEGIAVSATEEKYIAGIKTVAEDDTLKIYYDGDKNWYSKNKHLRAYVSFKELEKLDASGASDIVVAGEIKVSSLIVRLSGASDFKGTVTVNSLTMDLSGASDVNINGTASVVTIESSGASDIKGYDLTTDVCTARASGASDVRITINKELNAHASGASYIYYKGPAIIKDIQSSGASTISKKN